MELIKNSISISGDTLEVLESIAVDYPEVAQVTKEFLVVMSLAGLKKIELTEESYLKDLPQHIKIVLEDDKLMLEILSQDTETLKENTEILDKCDTLPSEQTIEEQEIKDEI